MNSGGGCVSIAGGARNVPSEPGPGGGPLTVSLPMPKGVQNRLKSSTSYPWFKEHFGFSEPDYVETRSKQFSMRWDELQQSQFLEVTATKRTFAVGRFSTPRLDLLRKKASVARAPFDDISKGAPLRLRLSNEVYTGGFSLQRAAGHRHATFQVSSGFNCLHQFNTDLTPTSLSVPEHGITGYGATSEFGIGPALSIATSPAAVFRNYFSRLDEQDCPNLMKTKIFQYGQTKACQINNLSDLEEVLGKKKFFEVDGGFIKVLNTRLILGLGGPASGVNNTVNLDRLRKSIRVGLHQDVQVVASDLRTLAPDAAPDTSFTISQVLSSGCLTQAGFMSGSGNNKFDAALYQGLCSLILEANYEATLAAALVNAERHSWEEGSNVVFLTPLFGPGPGGAGAVSFGGGIQWVR